MNQKEPSRIIYSSISGLVFVIVLFFLNYFSYTRGRVGTTFIGIIVLIIALFTIASSIKGIVKNKKNPDSKGNGYWIGSLIIGLLELLIAIYMFYISVP